MLNQYTEILPTLREVAREHGYALGVHGSGIRDLDLIAAPWIEHASSPAELAEGLRAAIGGFIINDDLAEEWNYTRRNPEPKPHGRLCWAIHLHHESGRLYIDLSVMPMRLGGERVLGTLATGLSLDEQQIMDHLVAAWQSFLKIDRGIKPDEQETFLRGIHLAQSVLACWAAGRAFPDYWKG